MTLIVPALAEQSAVLASHPDPASGPRDRSRNRARLRGPGGTAGRTWPHQRCALRELFRPDHRDPRRAAAPDQARAICRHGLGRTTPPKLSTASAAGGHIGRPAIGRADRERHLRGRSPCRASRRRLAGGCDLRPGLRCPPRCRGRRALPSRLVSRRWHRRRQRASGGRRHPRQLAEGPPPRALGLEVRQADRGCPARLVRPRPGTAVDRAACALPPRHADPSRPRHPVHHLRHPSVGRAGRARPRGSIRSSTGWGGNSTG